MTLLEPQSAPSMVNEIKKTLIEPQSTLRVPQSTE